MKISSICLVIILAFICQSVHGQLVSANDLEEIKVTTDLFVVDELHPHPFPSDIKVDCLIPYEDLFGKFGVWLKLTIASSGTLAFDIIPHNKSNDIDFLLFESQSSFLSSVPVRCMLAGPEIYNSYWEQSGCLGLTGMKGINHRSNKGSGCSHGDNYLDELQTSKGESFYLYVNNFNSPEGFTIIFDGTADITDRVVQDLDDFELVIKPNPTSGPLWAEFDLPYSIENGSFTLLDRSGRFLKEFKFEGLAQGSHSISMDISDLPAGLYIITSSFDSHSESHVIVKN